MFMNSLKDKDKLQIVSTEIEEIEKLIKGHKKLLYAIGRL